MSDLGDHRDDDLRAAFDRASSTPPAAADRVVAVHAKATQLHRRRVLFAAGTAAVVLAAGLGVALPLALGDGSQDSSHLKFANPSLSPSVVPTASATPAPSATPSAPARPSSPPPALVTSLTAGSFVSTTTAGEIGTPFNAYLPGSEKQPSNAFGANCGWGVPDPAPRAAASYTYWRASGDFEDSGHALDEFLIVTRDATAAKATVDRVAGWLRGCSKAFQPVQQLSDVNGEVYLHIGSQRTSNPIILPGYTAVGRLGNVVAIVDYGSQGEAPAGGATQSGTASVERAALRQARSTATRALAVPALKKDIDGDGRADTVTIKPEPAGSAHAYLLTAHLTRLGTRTVGIDASTQGGQLIGMQDMDGDGHAEVVVRSDHGASTDFWTIVRLVNDRLVQMTLDGSPVELAVGGSVMHQGGFNCNANYPSSWTPGYLLVTGYSSDDGGTTWSGKKVTYRYDGPRLVKVSTKSETWHGDQPALTGRYGGGVRCGNLPADAPWTPPAG